MNADSKSDSEDCVTLPKVLAGGIRFRIAKEPLRGPGNVSELRDDIEVEATLLSHHLRAMRDVSLVVSRRDGMRMIHSLADRAESVGKGGRIDRGCCSLSCADECKG